MIKRIRDLREDADLTQKEVGIKLNMSQSQYQKYESGFVTPSINVLLSIAELYDVSLDYLLNRTNYKKVVQAETMRSKNNRLISYYNRLSLEDQDYIMGKMVELYKEKDTSKKGKSERHTG